MALCRCPVCSWLALGVTLLAAVLLAGCGVAYRAGSAAVTDVTYAELWHQGRRGPLSEEEKAWAKAAWAYFEVNRHGETGFVNAATSYPVVTMWQVADHLAALQSARDLDLIDQTTFDQRVGRMIGTLATMDLFEGRVPNTAYSAITGDMVGFDQAPGEVGWSAVDIGRLLLRLRILQARAPKFAEYVDRVVLRWTFCGLHGRNGVLYGAAREGEHVKRFADGGIGTRHYARAGFRAWGLPVKKEEPPDERHRMTIYDVSFPYEINALRARGASNYLITLPFALYGMELGFDADEVVTVDQGQDDDDHYMKSMMDVLIKTQQRRYQRTGITTARTDHQLGEAPFFLHSTVIANGFPWGAVSREGTYHERQALVATSAAFGLWAAESNAYTDHLTRVVGDLYDSEKGWFEGRREVSGLRESVMTSTTNAAVLEALAFKARGPALQERVDSPFAGPLLADPFRHPGRCLPGDVLERELPEHWLPKEGGREPLPVR